jgi:hypothetical protein
VAPRSKKKGVKNRLRRGLEKEGITVDEMEGLLQERITIDPLRFALHNNAARTLMILSVFDNVAPFKTGKELRRAMGAPETDYLVTGHSSALLYMP